jgi:hypothetical protein
MIPLLYDAKTIDTLEWPETDEGSNAKQFLDPLIKNGINYYFENVYAEILVIKIDHFVFPVLLPTAHKPNQSYVCSPYQHYITMGKENINLVPNPFVVAFVKPLMSLLERVAQWGQLDSVVYVNNWLFSIDLYPEGLTEEHIQAIVSLLETRFPKRAIIFRSLNKITSSKMISSLDKVGFKLVASRYVFISDVKNEEIFHTRIFKSDLRLWEKTSFTVVDESDLSLDDANEFLRLKNLLCVHQHHSLQPEINNNFMELLLKQHWLHFKALKFDGIIKCVIGYFQLDEVMYCSFIGFDKNDVDHNIVYRLLNTLLFLEAKKCAHFFNQSAGASFYKSVRRAKGTVEFIAVYTRHLTYRQKITWALLRLCMNTLGVFYMKRY